VCYGIFIRMPMSTCMYGAPWGALGGTYKVIFMRLLLKGIPFVSLVTTYNVTLYVMSPINEETLVVSSAFIRECAMWSSPPLWDIMVLDVRMMRGRLVPRCTVTTKLAPSMNCFGKHFCSKIFQKTQCSSQNL
jgi:hypothetical protein